MPPRVVKKNAGTTAQKNTAAKAPSKYPMTPAKPVSSTQPKVEPEAVKTAEVKPSPTVETPKAEEKAIEPFQDLKKPSVKVEPRKKFPSRVPMWTTKNPPRMLISPLQKVARRASRK
jgi:hypothetical protein